MRLGERFSGQPKRYASANDLPIELLQEIASLVYEGDAQNILGFASSCIYLRVALRPILFQRIKTQHLWAPTDKDLLKKFMDTVGSHARSVRLQPSEMLHTENFIPCVFSSWCQWLSLFPKIHSLTIEIEPKLFHDLRAFTPFAKLLEHHRSLKRLSLFEETHQFMPQIPDSYYAIIGHIISIAGPAIESLSMDLKSPINDMVFEQIRHRTSNLKEMEFLREISYLLRDRFNHPTAWACAETLTTFKATDCAGLHATQFAWMVVRGTWKKLVHLELDACGSHRDTSNNAAPNLDLWNLNNAALDYFQLVHFAPWEVEALSCIRTRVLSVKELNVPKACEALKNLDRFMYLEKLVVHKSMLPEGIHANEQELLMEVCKERNVEFVIIDGNNESLDDAGWLENLF